MNSSCCCQRKPRTGHEARQQKSWLRRVRGVAGWILPSTLLALMPKCPICLAAYVALCTGFTMSGSSAHILMRTLTVLSEQELYAAAKDLQAPYELVRMVAKAGKLPVPNFSAGGIATPADAALMMQLGAEAIFVGSGIFMKERATPLDVENSPKEREEAVSHAKAIVVATTHWNDPKILAEVAEQVTGTMKGLAAAGLEESQLLQTRGW